MLSFIHCVDRIRHTLYKLKTGLLDLNFIPNGFHHRIVLYSTTMCIMSLYFFSLTYCICSRSGIGTVRVNNIYISLAVAHNSKFRHLLILRVCKNYKQLATVSVSLWVCLSVCLSLLLSSVPTWYQFLSHKVEKMYASDYSNCWSPNPQPVLCLCDANSFANENQQRFKRNFNKTPWEEAPW